VPSVTRQNVVTDAVFSQVGVVASMRRASAGVAMDVRRHQLAQHLNVLGSLQALLASAAKNCWRSGVLDDLRTNDLSTLWRVGILLVARSQAQILSCETANEARASQ